jgi:hypothetical protein
MAIHGIHACAYMMSSQVPLVASAQMNKTYQPSEALDPTPMLSIKWAAPPRVGP